MHTINKQTLAIPYTELYVSLLDHSLAKVFAFRELKWQLNICLIKVETKFIDNEMHTDRHMKRYQYMLQYTNCCALCKHETEF